MRRKGLLALRFVDRFQSETFIEGKVPLEALPFLGINPDE
jgi:hypothetical protein